MISQIVNSLVPLFLLILLGAVLAARGFLKAEFLSQLNRLIYWVALPSLIVMKLSVAEFQLGGASRVFAVIVAITLSGGVIAGLVAWMLRIPVGSWGTFSQAVFRGNLALVGLPVLIYDLNQRDVEGSEEIIAIALLALGMTMILYNVLSVIVLLVSYNHSGAADEERIDLQKLLRRMTRQVVTNPLILAAIVGSFLSLMKWPPPDYLQSALGLAGDMAVPAALICIGARLGTTQLASNLFAPGMAAVLKVALIPLLAYGFARLFGITGEELSVVMIYAASPTAVASYIMATELHGDPDIASGAIALSTLLSAISLAVALVFF